MPTITELPSDLNLYPVSKQHSASSSSSSSRKPTPSRDDLKPWTFKYASAPDGKDLNLLIMFHGLGDNDGPFFKLAKELNLPSTAVLSLQGPLAIPLMETPTYWSWYQTFSPTLNPLPNPSPAPTIPPLLTLINALVRLGWQRRQIHLFGWGQGGSMVLSLVQALGAQRPEGSDELPERLGSAVSACGSLLSSASPPSSSSSSSSSTGKAQTPVAYFTRKSPASAAYKKDARDVEAAFADVQILRGTNVQGQQDAMIRGQQEWKEVMIFWGANLMRDESGFMKQAKGAGGEGELYEIR